MIYKLTKEDVFMRKENKTVMIHNLNNIYVQELDVNPQQFRKLRAERIVMAFYIGLGYKVEKVMSSHNIASNHDKVNKILTWYKNLIENREAGENGMPDLIVYKNSIDWFFVEVKAYNDAVRPIQLIWYKKHQKYPVRICIVSPNKDSKHTYTAKNENVPCKHQFIELYRSDTGKICPIENIKKERSGSLVYLHGHFIGWKCKKCGLFKKR